MFMSGGREGGGCCDQVPSSLLPPPPPFSDRMTNTCENITFTRFATRAVIKLVKFSISASEVLYNGQVKIKGTGLHLLINS